MPNRKTDLWECKKEYESVSMSEEAVNRMKQRIQEGKEARKSMKTKKFYKGFAVAAAAAVVIVGLPNTSSTVANAMESIPVVGGLFKVVTFRDYQYADDKQEADVSVPEISVDSSDGDGETVANAKKSSEEINAEIEKLTDKWINKFKADKKKEGYQNMKIKSEVVNTTEDYFTLKLTCYQAAASGYEENHFYTIHLNNGKRLSLSDLFQEGSDFITPISKNIKKQMREQMAADENVSYWLDDKDIPACNFKKISKDVAFYVNADGEVVICFHEGDVAPMYMGNVEFTIPDEVIAGIRK